MKDISMFHKNGLCQLPFKVRWVNLVRVSMCAIMSVEGTKPPSDCTSGKWNEYIWS